MKILFEKLEYGEKALVGYLNGSPNYDSGIEEITNDVRKQLSIIESIKLGELNAVINTFESELKTMKIQVVLGYLNFAIQKKATALTAYLLEITNGSEAKASYDEFLVRQEKIAFGIELPTVEDLEYSWDIEVIENDVFLGGYVGVDDSIFVPNKTKNGMNVILWEVNNEYVTSVVLADGITSIENGAFSGCEYLIDIAIPEGVTSIGSRAFSSCKSLVDVVIPEGVTSIGSRAFSSCKSLVDVVIPEGVTAIGGGTFSDCISLVEFVIPEGVTAIGGGAFSDCISLVEFVIPEGVTSIGGGAFSWCESLVEITIPEGVTSIGEGAFYGCKSLEKITIPETVTSIEEDAFHGCDSLGAIPTSK